MKCLLHLLDFTTQIKILMKTFLISMRKMNALFLIGGLRFNYDIFSADLAIADSHLFGGDFRKQTIGKLAIGVQL